MSSISRPPNLSDRVLTLEGKVDALGADVQTIIRKVDEGNILRANENRDRWSKVVGSASVIGGIFAFVVNSMIGEKIMPLQEFKTSATTTMTRSQEVQSKQQDMLTAIVSQNATSIQERSDMRQMVQNNFERLSTLEKAHASHVAHNNAVNVEIETQVSALEQVQNMRQAHQDRINKITWDRTEAGDFPDAPMPEFRISNRNPKGFSNGH